MENVEQRRQRLAAMREQADLQTEILLAPSTLPFTFDPLDSSPAASPSADGKNSHFDFYTDPLAGFSGSKRRRPALPGVLPAPSNTAQASNRAPQFNPGSIALPPYQAPMWQPVPYQVPEPMFAGAPQQYHPPQFYPQATPQNLSQFANQGFPGQGRSSPGFQGQGAYFSNANRGTGGGRGYNGFGGGGRDNSWNPGRGSGGNLWDVGASSRGRNGHGRGPGRSGAANDGLSARGQPHRYYKKSMVEDPWQHLEASGAGT